MLYVFFRFLARWLFLLLGGVRVLGQPRRLPGGGLIIASNHQSYLDPLLLGVGHSRPMSFMARDTLFRNPVFGPFIRAVHAFPVRRDGVGTSGLKEAVRRLRAGEAVVVFPEGTRSRDGEVQTIKDGAGLLSRLAGVPVLPAAVDSFRSWPRGRALPLPAPTRVAFGKVIPAVRFKEDPEGARNQLEQAIRVLHQNLLA